jgi:hypothetical protein
VPVILFGWRADFYLVAVMSLGKVPAGDAKTAVALSEATSRAPKSARRSRHDVDSLSVISARWGEGADSLLSYSTNSD